MAQFYWVLLPLELVLQQQHGLYGIIKCLLDACSFCFWAIAADGGETLCDVAKKRSSVDVGKLMG